jgi:hypothetical protein
VSVAELILTALTVTAIALFLSALTSAIHVGFGVATDVRALRC